MQSLVSEKRQSIERSVDTPGSHVNTIRDDLSFLLELFILGSKEFGETPFLRDHNTLLAGEFILGSSQGFHGTLDVVLGGSDGVEGLADFDTGALLVGLTEGTSHTALETIGTGAGQHLVDTDNVPGVHAASHVEGFLTAVLDHVFVGGHTGGFHSARGNLFFFP